MGSTSGALPSSDTYAHLELVDVDDTTIAVHGHAKPGAGFSYSKVRGLKVQLATQTIAGRHRWHSPAHAARFEEKRAAVRLRQTV